MNDSVPLNDFPVRPPLREGESLGSWCWRIYLANGHDVPQSLRLAARTIRAEQEMGADHVLGNLFGIKRLAALRARESRLTERWDPRFWPDWYEWATAPRFCPLCVAEIGCHLLSWDLPLMSACATHGCHLVDRCHACKRKLSWTTLQHGWQCLCGASVQEAPAKPSPRFTVHLSRILCAASDAQVPRAIRQFSASTQITSHAYRTRDVYEVLWWLLTMRRVLADQRNRYFRRSRLNLPEKCEPRAIGSWEISAIANLPTTIEIKARHALLWLFRDDRKTLVDLGSFEDWSDAEKLIDDLDGARNPLAGLIRKAIERVRNRARADIPGQSRILFNPRLTAAQRCQRVIKLDAWLHRFSAETKSLDLRDRLVPRNDWSDCLEHWYEFDPDIGLINVLFEAARHGIPTRAFGALALRWRLPVGLQKPSDLMAQLGGYLATLHKDEQMFLLDLAVSAFKQHEDQVQKRSS